MIKGTCGKIETLSDGSLKLSIYGKREDLAIAGELDNQEVLIDLATKADKPQLLSAIRSALDRLEGLWREEQDERKEEPEKRE